MTLWSQIQVGALPNRSSRQIQSAVLHILNCNGGSSTLLMGVPRLNTSVRNVIVNRSTGETIIKYSKRGSSTQYSNEGVKYQMEEGKKGDPSKT